MYEQMLESFRKSTETGMQFQQDLLRQWTSVMSGPQVTQTSWFQQRQKAQKEFAAAVSDLLHKHRATLDANYQAGIKTVEDAFRVAEAKDPVEFKQKAEEFYRRSFDVVKTAFETQVQQYQGFVEKYTDLVAKTMP